LWASSKIDQWIAFLYNLQPPPVWTADDHHEGIVYAPHWYDLKSLFTKTFDGYITHDVQGLSRVSISVAGVASVQLQVFIFPAT
jgi:hypothetical protein